MNTTKQIAAELAPELDRRIEAFLARPGGDDESNRRRDDLKSLLWDNKVGILRVLQSHAAACQ